MPKAFAGSKVDGTGVDSWIISMNLYFAAVDLPQQQQTIRAALNLVDKAAV